MSATLIIAGWWLLFGGTHVLLSSARVRPRLVDRLGERSFQAVYSLVALASFVPLCVYYGRHKHLGPQLWVTLEPYLLARDFNIGCMLLAFVLLVGGILQRPPSSLLAQGYAPGLRHDPHHPSPRFCRRLPVWPGPPGAGRRPERCGLFRRLCGVCLARGQAPGPAQEAAICPAMPSFRPPPRSVPFAAIVGKKQPFPGRELRWGMILLAVILFYVVRFYHPAIFGGVLMTL